MSGDVASWVPVLAALAGSSVTGVIQFVMNRQNHANALEREEKAAAVKLQNEKQALEDKLRRERYFIATELVLMLEFFASECADVAVSGVDMFGRKTPGVSVPSPQLRYDGTEGDWRAVPDVLLYRIRELPVLCGNAEALIRYVCEYGDNERGKMECRQYQYARIGLFALFAAAKLRRECGLPAPREDTDSRAVFSTLWRWRRRLWRERLRNEGKIYDI